MSIANLQIPFFCAQENTRPNQLQTCALHQILIFFLQELSIKTEGDVLIVLAKHETKAEGT